MGEKSSNFERKKSHRRQRSNHEGVWTYAGSEIEENVFLKICKERVKKSYLETMGAAAAVAVGCAAAVAAAAATSAAAAAAVSDISSIRCSSL